MLDILCVSVGVSNRHIHLSREHLNLLFGKDAELTVFKELKQPGQCAANEKVIIKGPKGAMDGVRILFPLREQTQLEISRADAIKLGAPVCLRQSGDLAGSPGIELVGPKGSVMLKEGAIVALRHLHIDEETAEKHSLKDKMIIDIQTSGERALTFSNVLVRVSPEFVPEFHVDRDEANAACLENGDSVVVLL